MSPQKDDHSNVFPHSCPRRCGVSDHLAASPADRGARSGRTVPTLTAASRLRTRRNPSQPRFPGFRPAGLYRPHAAGRSARSAAAPSAAAGRRTRCGTRVYVRSGRRFSRPTRRRTAAQVPRTGVDDNDGRLRRPLPILLPATISVRRQPQYRGSMASGHRPNRWRSVAGGSDSQRRRSVDTGGLAAGRIGSNAQQPSPTFGECGSTLGCPS